MVAFLHASCDFWLYTAIFQTLNLQSVTCPAVCATPKPTEMAGGGNFCVFRRKYAFLKSIFEAFCVKQVGVSSSRRLW